MTQSEILRQQAEAERLTANSAGMAPIREAALREAERYDRLAEEREKVEREAAAFNAADPDPAV